MPSKIMIIRHAEKPAKEGPPYGISINGQTDSYSLISQGWQRAGALARFFNPYNEGFNNSNLATPGMLYASGIGPHSNSLRPQETISVVASLLKLQVNTQYLKADYTNMINDVLKQDGVVLICWEHQDIPSIANQIPCGEEIPQQWPGDRFDLVWVFDLEANNSSYSFVQVPQMLLPGDLPTPIT